MIFNDPELNLRAEYSLFDRQTGRPVCIGNGKTCQRLINQGVEQHSCPSPDLCSLAQGGLCKPYGRLYVNLDESDEFGTFVFRTTGFNSIRTLAARLSYYHAASNVLLSCLHVQLTAMPYLTRVLVSEKNKQYILERSKENELKWSQPISAKKKLLNILIRLLSQRVLI